MKIKLGPLKNNFFALCIALIVILFSFVAYSLITIINYNSMEKALVDIISTIDKENSKTSALISSSSINSASTKNQVYKIGNSLSEAEKTLNSLKENGRYAKLKNNLKKGLKNNVLLYKQLLACLYNPDSPDIENSLAAIAKYENLCSKYYSNIKVNGKDFDLPNKTLEFIKSSQTYLSNRERVKKDEAFKAAQNSEFDSTIDDICGKFNNIRTNFSSYVDEVRKKQLTYDDVLTKVDKNDENFEALKDNLNNVNIPENRLDIYNSLKTVFDDYDSYINSFTSAVTYESGSKDSSGSVSPNTDDYYKTASSKFYKITKDYNAFIKKYSSVKNK